MLSRDRQVALPSKKRKAGQFLLQIATFANSNYKVSSRSLQSDKLPAFAVSAEAVQKTRGLCARVWENVCACASRCCIRFANFCSGSPRDSSSGVKTRFALKSPCSSVLAMLPAVAFKMSTTVSEALDATKFELPPRPKAMVPREPSLDQESDARHSSCRQRPPFDFDGASVFRERLLPRAGQFGPRNSVSCAYHASTSTSQRLLPKLKTY